ncbi:MAG TPA: HAD-IA family hydrolase [Clostridia bacterium]|nr:HAD-IA family hydrolase [Clostridia bacterium]
MFKGMIFDMDGVIVDSHPSHLRAWKRLFACLGKPLSDSGFEYILDGHTREEILRHYLGDMSAERLEEYGNRKDKLFREEAAGLLPVPGVLAFLDSIEQAGIRKAVATSAKRQRADFILGHFGISRRFETIVAADDVAEGKSSSRAFLLAGERLSLSPRELLVAEDAVSGVKAAKAASMRCLGVSLNGHRRQLLGAGADKVVSDFCSVSVPELSSLF